MKNIFKIEQIGDGSLEEILKRGINGYAIEKALHGRAISLFLFIVGGWVLKIQTVMNMVGDWHEVGTLKVQILAEQEKLPEKITLLKNWSNLKLIQKLVLDEDNFIAESGLHIQNMDGEECVIVAGALPHTVEILAPFHSNDFDPEYELKAYKRTSF